MIRSRRTCSCLAAASVAGLTMLLPAPAQDTPPQARLSSIFPPGARIGTTVEVEVAGQDLDELSGLDFSAAGLTAHPLVPESDRFGIPQSIDVRRFLVSVASDAEPGVYEARVKGRFGLSNPSPFVIGTVEESIVIEPNHDPASATPIGRPSVVHGRIEDNLIDHFRFAARRRERVTIAVWAERLGSRADPVVEVRDAEGRVLGRANNVVGRDAVMTVPIPADGEYLLTVFDSLFDGGVDYHYRLECDAAPVAVSVFPAAVRRGHEERFEIAGFGLADPRGAARHSSGGWAELMLLPVKGTTECGIGRIPAHLLPVGEISDRLDVRLRARDGFGSPWSAPILIVDHAVTLEREPNGGFDEASIIESPAVIGGRFERAGDVDVHLVQVQPGQPLWIEVVSSRLGAPTDPYLSIHRLRPSVETSGDAAAVGTSGAPAVDGGTVLWSAERLGEADDIDAGSAVARASVTCRDAAYRLELGEAATCAIVLENRFETGGIDCGYVLSIALPQPSFELIAACERPFVDDRKLDLWSANLTRGGSVAIDVAVRRMQGFAGSVSLSVEGLPEGIQCTPALIPPGENTGRLIVRHDGASHAEGWVGDVRILGIGEAIDSTPRPARVAVLARAVGNVDQERVMIRDACGLRLALRANDPAPLALEIGEPTSGPEIVLGGMLELPVKLTAAPGELKGDVRLVATGIPGMRKPAETTIKAGETETVFRIPFERTNDNPLRAGACDLVVRAEAVFVHRANPEAEARWKAEAERLAGLASEAAAVVQQLEAELAAATEADVDQQKSALNEKKREVEELAAGKARVDQFTQASAERAKPTDRRTAAFSQPLRITVKEPPPAE